MVLRALVDSVFGRPKTIRRHRPSSHPDFTFRPWRLERLEERLAPSRTITSVTLNGGPVVPVHPNESIAAIMDVTTAGNGSNDNWHSVGWLISTTPPGSYNVVDTPDHDGAGSYSEPFSVTAPSASGTYNAYFAA